MGRATVLKPLRRNEPKKLKHWDSRDYARLLELLEQGWTDGEISFYLRMKESQILRARRKKGWPPGPEMAGFWTASDVANLMGFSERSSAVRRWVQKGWLRASVRRRPGVTKSMIMIKQQWLFDFMESPAHLHRWNWEPIRDPVIREMGRRLREGKVLTLQEAADEIGVQVSTVRSWVRRHKLDVLSDGAGKSSFLTRDQVDKIKREYEWSCGFPKTLIEIAE